MASYDFVTTTGTIVPDTAELRADVESEFREAFGADLVVSPDTPQGLLITAETLARDAVARNNAALANQINPDLAGGIFLDALWALTGGSRIEASFSLIVGVALAGSPGTVIPAGVRARVGASGPLFALTGQVTLDGTGAGTGTFQAVDAGPVAAPATDLDTIVDAVLGWETVTNPAPAIVGQAEESDVSARRRRRVTLGLQSVALPESIISGLYTVDGVRSVLFRENVTDAPIVIETVNLAAHSIYVCVEGGTDAAVAAELLARKSLGANWNGGTTVTVVDPFSTQAYDVTFDRPDIVPVYVKVTVRQGTEVNNPVAVVRAAILAYAAGNLAGEEGLGIGADVSPWEIAGAINEYAPGLYVKKVEIGLAPDALNTTILNVNIDKMAQILEGAIAVVVE